MKLEIMAFAVSVAIPNSIPIPIRGSNTEVYKLPLAGLTVFQDYFKTNQIARSCGNTIYLFYLFIYLSRYFTFKFKNYSLIQQQYKYNKIINNIQNSDKNKHNVLC